VSLYPGEGVYSKINGGTEPDGDTATKVYLTATGFASTFSDGTALLTYNANSDIDGTAIAGTTTGVALASIGIGGRFAAEPLGPFRISGNDVLRRNGRGNQPNNLPRLSRRVVR